MKSFTQTWHLPFIGSRVDAHRCDYHTPRGTELRGGTNVRRRSNSLSTTISSEQNKIPKPPGEPGSQGQEDVDALTKTVRTEARRALDMTVSFRSQKQESIEKICDKMMGEDRWPQLKDYSDCWPVRSILKLALKYGAEASRRANTKDTIKRIRSALRDSEI
ncbi:hypothetical protein BD779DRAFT_1520455 [Infundibulicybe gibba]|nr:hypothetical protein BD779DRAFT_1520455 [Infundibulicybe gibba]